MKLGVQAAVVDGMLLRGDVEIADGRIVAVGVNGGTAAASRSRVSSTCR